MLHSELSNIRQANRHLQGYITTALIVSAVSPSLLRRRRAGPVNLNAASKLKGYSIGPEIIMGEALTMLQVERAPVRKTDYET